MTVHPTVSPSEIVLRFVESLGRRADTDFYLRLFRELPKPSFAVIAPDSSALEHSSRLVIEHLRFLSQLGLHTSVVLGLTNGPTDPELGDRFEQYLAGAGLLHRRCAATPNAASQLRSLLELDTTPVVRFDKESIAVASRLTWMGSWAAELQTRKLVLVRAGGGLGPHQDGAVELEAGASLPTTENGISVINLLRDQEPLLRHPHLSSEEQTLLRAAAEVMRGAAAGRVRIQDQLVTSVTSPPNLLHELFTVRGAGTLIKHGSQIQRHTNYASLDQPRLARLLESSFGRPLSEAFFQAPPLCVYVEREYRGAAVVRSAMGGSFLTKFAVEREAQGLGLGRDLWDAVTQEHPILFWRARRGNPIATWYESQAEGRVCCGEWTVYFRGFSHEAIPELLREAMAQPRDFAP